MWSKAIISFQFQSLIERHEEDIEDWYFNLQDKYSFTEYVCSKKALKGEDSCLTEKVKKKKKNSKKKKGETGEKDELWNWTVPSDKILHW